MSSREKEVVYFYKKQKLTYEKNEPEVHLHHVLGEFFRNFQERKCRKEREERDAALYGGT